MSLIEKITVIQDVLIEMSANQKIFYEELEKIKGMLNILVARPFKIVEKENPIVEKVIVKGGSIISKKENNTTEEVEQDLAQVLLFNETEKAFLAVKHGFQVWVAKSHLENSEGYDLGNTYDLKVKEKSKWVLKKLDWKPFEVFKD